MRPRALLQSQWTKGSNGARSVVVTRVNRWVLLWACCTGDVTWSSAINSLCLLTFFSTHKNNKVRNGTSAELVLNHIDAHHEKRTRTETKKLSTVWDFVGKRVINQNQTTLEKTKKKKEIENPLAESTTTTKELSEGHIVKDDFQEIMWREKWKKRKETATPKENKRIEKKWKIAKGHNSPNSALQ